MKNIDALNIFSSISETLSFSTTAQQFHISQSIVSKRIKELEQELNVQLFYRLTLTIP